MPKTAKPVKAAKATKPAAKAAKPAAASVAPRRSSGRVPNLDQPLDLTGFKFGKGAKAQLAKGVKALASGNSKSFRMK